MQRFLYTKPDGTRVVDPTENVLHALLFDTAWSEWDSSPNAESCLEVILDAGAPADGDAFVPFNISREHPSLIIKQPNPDLFFITFMHNGTQLVPYNGGSISDYTQSHSGGDPFYIPLACTVDAEAADRIVLAYRGDLIRDPSVHWVDWCDLDLPADWY